MKKTKTDTERLKEIEEEVTLLEGGITVSFITEEEKRMVEAVEYKCSSKIGSLGEFSAFGHTKKEAEEKLEKFIKEIFESIFKGITPKGLGREDRDVFIFNGITPKLLLEDKELLRFFLSAVNLTESGKEILVKLIEVNKL